MTQEERNNHYIATLAVVIEGFDEIDKKLRSVAQRYQALLLSRNGLAFLAGQPQLVIPKDQKLRLSTPEQRALYLEHFKKSDPPHPQKR